MEPCEPKGRGGDWTEERQASLRAPERRGKEPPPRSPGGERDNTVLMPIGAFAREARLSQKALRLYDELGLLPPAHVDPWSGYRSYHPAQLEQARLVAWLRRLGMPLARIRVVCELAPAQAAQEVAAYWAQVESDTASRRDLAAFLIESLSGRTAMAGTSDTLAIRYAARSDIGLVRETNQDSAYAGTRLLAVADGMGSGGQTASAAVIDALKPLENALPAADLLNALEDAVQEASAAVGRIPGGDEGIGTGSTITAMVLSGSQLALVHIGDCRAYLLRDGELFQVTHDHTLVQSLLDEGKIRPEEAASHPQRSLLLRAIDGSAQVRADTALHDAVAGDRYLLCSDGLTGVVSEDAILGTLRGVSDPEQAAAALIEAANAGGGPDNVSCVVADIVPAQQQSARK
jgi:PPM family protein phosphatase